MCWTCLLKTSIPAIPCRNSKHPLPGRSNFLTAAARSTLFALGLHKIPSLRCSCWKNQSYAEKQRVWSWSCGLQDLLQCSDCALSCAMWPLQTVNNYRDWAFSISGLEMGLPALQLADVGKMRRTAERRFVGHVCLRNPFLPFLLGIPSIHCLAEATSWQRQHAPPSLH